MPTINKILHSRRRRKGASMLPLTLLTLLQVASSEPIPASIFKTWTSAGNPLLHIQPAFHHDTSETSLLRFTSVFLAHEAGIKDSLLADSFSQDVTGVELPSLKLSGRTGATVFDRRDVGFNGTDTGEVWIMTYPVDCKAVENSTISDYQLYKGRPGGQELEPIDLGAENANSTSWKPAARYLGRGLSNPRSAIGTGMNRLYSFGGLCLGSTNYTGNGRNDSFSSEFWKLENTTTIKIQERAEEHDEAKDINVRLAITKNPPIPEAGFSMTTLAVNRTNETTGSDGMLILGGYTGNSKFVGLGQLAIYSLEDEGWNFAPASLKGRAIGARAGHSAVLDEKNENIILFGGWIGNITQPASPSLVTLKVGSLEGGWEWNTLNTTEQSPGDGPGNLALWGHAATLLEGNVMLLTSGFEVGEIDEQGRQTVNDKTFLLNLTSKEWISSYRYPNGFLSTTAVEENDKRKGRDIGIIAGVLGGVLILAIGAILLFCYARKKEDYHDIAEDMLVRGPDKFDSLDLEYGKNAVIVDGATPPLNYSRRMSKRRVDDFGRRMTSPDLPPLPEPIKAHYPSHLDVDRITKLQEEQEQHENAVSHGLQRPRSVRSDMVAWVREWANADAAAQAAELLQNKKDAAELLQNQKDEAINRPKTRKADRKDSKASKNLLLPEPYPNRCITSSSVYSDGQVSTLTASEIYDTPVDEVPYPIPPMLLSTTVRYGEQPSRHPRILVGQEGVTVSLPKKMAQEFPQPTLIPRDSLADSAFGSNYHYSYGSSTQPLIQRDRQSSWQDVTPRESSAGQKFYNIPLTTFEETETTKGKSLEDRVREEMYNPGPARTEEECRLSSIMDYYVETKGPTPVPEQSEDQSDDDDENGNLMRTRSPASLYSGDKATLGQKAKVVVINRMTVDEPYLNTPYNDDNSGHTNPRESVVMPLLSEQDATGESFKGKGKAADRGSSTKSRSSLASIKRKAAAVAHSFSPADRRRSSSVGKQKNGMQRFHTGEKSIGKNKDPRSTMSEVALLQPQSAEIEHVNDYLRRGNKIHADKYNDDDDDDMDMADKVVQVIYTAPKGKLRVVNPSPRRLSSGGTERSSIHGARPTLQSQRRVSSAGVGTYEVIANGEAILRLGSTAGRRFAEMD